MRLFDTLHRLCGERRNVNLFLCLTKVMKKVMTQSVLLLVIFMLVKLSKCELMFIEIKNINHMKWAVLWYCLPAHASDQLKKTIYNFLTVLYLSHSNQRPELHLKVTTGDIILVIAIPPWLASKIGFLLLDSLSLLRLKWMYQPIGFSVTMALYPCLTLTLCSDIL